MGQLIVSEMVSLDSVMQAPGGPEEDTEDGFKHGGWQAPLLDEESLSLITRDIGANGRPAPGSQDLRHLRRVLAQSHDRQEDRGQAQQRTQVRGLPQPPQTRME